jgi:hypothetical protein
MTTFTGAKTLGCLNFKAHVTGVIFIGEVTDAMILKTLYDGCPDRLQTMKYIEDEKNWEIPLINRDALTALKQSPHTLNSFCFTEAVHCCGDVMAPDTCGMQSAVRQVLEPLYLINRDAASFFDLDPVNRTFGDRVSILNRTLRTVSGHPNVELLPLYEPQSDINVNSNNLAFRFNVEIFGKLISRDVVHPDPTKRNYSQLALSIIRQNTELWESVLASRAAADIHKVLNNPIEVDPYCGIAEAVLEVIDSIRKINHKTATFIEESNSYGCLYDLLELARAAVTWEADDPVVELMPGHQ